MKDRVHWIVVIFAFWVSSSCAVWGEDHVLPPRPFKISLNEKSAIDPDELKAVPGVRSVSSKGGSLEIEFQPFNDNPWGKAGEGKPKWIAGAEKIYDFLPIKKKLGKTIWTHGGIGNINADTIIWSGPVISGSSCYPLSFNLMFDDQSTKKSEVMRVVIYSESDPERLVHEMLRGIVGSSYRIEKCGGGYVVVAGEGRRSHVAWQINDLSYIKIDFCFDREMVSAYVERFGSVVKKEFSISVEKWVEDELRWRMEQLDSEYKVVLERGLKKLVFARYLFSYFPDASKRFGCIMKPYSNPRDLWANLNACKLFLFSNRHNFSYNSSSGQFLLKGDDRFDPSRPPVLSDDWTPLPPPLESQLEAARLAMELRDREYFDSVFNGQFSDWKDQYKSILSKNDSWDSLDVRFPFSELREIMKVRKPSKNKKDAEDWLRFARGWLWANRDNFVSRDGSFFLKGKDLFDPASPVKVPDELRE